MSQLFEELVLPFVQSHGQACSVLLAGKAPEELGEEAARQLLWPVRAMCAASAALACLLGSFSGLFGCVVVKCSEKHVSEWEA
jgi:hypothetical protein